MILAISAFAALVSMGNAAIGAAANIVLDAALICGFHLGVQGAALAAVLSQGMSAISARTGAFCGFACGISASAGSSYGRVFCWEHRPR